MSNGGGGGEAEDGNVNGRGRKRDHQQVEEDDHEAVMRTYPTGYRFRPTDEELIKYYLYRKVNKLRLPPNLIKEVNIYALHPSDLSDTYRSYGDNAFYFFTPRERKYLNGKRPNRAANGGYWKANGTDDAVNDTKTNTAIGYKRVLVFYRGKPPKTGDPNKAKILKETKTDWRMHEYTLKKLKDEENDKRPFTDVGSSSDHKQLDEFVLCKLYIKSRKSAKDIKCPGKVQCKDKAVDATRPPSIANATSSAVVPEDHHQMHQAVVATSVVGDHQYPLPSRLAMASAGETVPQYQQFMCQTNDVGVGNHQYPLTSRVETAGVEVMEPEYQRYMCQSDVAAGNHHRYSLTSMVLEAAAEMEMMPFNYNCDYLDNGNPSFSSAPLSAILPSANHNSYGQMNQQQQLQLAILPSVNHHYNGEMNQQQLQPVVLHSGNQHTNVQMNQHQWQPAVNHHFNAEMNQQQLQPAVIHSGNQHTNVQMNQHQWQPAVNHHFNAEMNQQQLQPAILPSVNQHSQMNHQQLKPAVLPSVNHHTNGQIMNQQELDEKEWWDTFVADLKEIGY